MDSSNPLFSEKTSSSNSSKITPRIILHGGAGSLSRSTLDPSTLAAYRQSLLTILSSAQEKLQCPGATALDIATEAVTQLENNPLFNAGTGAVFTTAGTHELEASVMVSRGFRKRGVGVMGVTRARNPVLLAREVLVRAESQRNECGGEDSAQGHSQLHGRTCDRFVDEWGLQSARPSYFFGWKSWVQHRKGRGLSVSREEFEEAKWKADKEAGWDEDDEGQMKGRDGQDVGSVGVDETSFPSPCKVDARLVEDSEDEFVPQGTVGCVVLDATGTLCAATSTGGMTNKLPGRIGDTPTLGAGFWAEEWTSTHDLPVEESEAEDEQSWSKSSWMSLPSSILKDCLPGLSSDYFPLPNRPSSKQTTLHRPHRRVRAVAMSGTGNGDSFLRVNAVRTAAAMARWASPAPSSTAPTYSPGGRRDAYTSLQAAVTAVAGPGGVLEQSAEDRWESGEGQGGIIGIELDDGVGKVVFDYNCGGMFHAWVDDRGEKRFAVFQDEK